MADDIAKRDFSVILDNLNRKFDITDCKWTKNNIFEFEIKFRTHIKVEHNDYNTYCDIWADEFSQVTDTVWVHKISNTGPKVKFRKQYQCWTYEDKEVKKELLFDARRCRGTLDIKILGEHAGIKKTNKYLRLGLNALIKINFYHLHPVDVRQNYSFFVHHCEPQPEPPKLVVPSNEKISQLVKKMVQNAAVTSQKAAERAQEALKRQCIVPQSVNHNMQQPQAAVEVPQTISYQQEDVDTEQYEAPVTQVIVNSNGQTTETYYLQQVVFDSATQTITEVMSPQLIEVPMSESTHLSLEMPHQANDSQSVIQQY